MWLSMRGLVWTWMRRRAGGCRRDGKEEEKETRGERLYTLVADDGFCLGGLHCVGWMGSASGERNVEDVFRAGIRVSQGRRDVWAQGRYNVSVALILTLQEYPSPAL